MFYILQMRGRNTEFKQTRLLISRRYLSAWLWGEVTWSYARLLNESYKCICHCPLILRKQQVQNCFKNAWLTGSLWTRMMESYFLHTLICSSFFFYIKPTIFPWNKCTLKVSLPINFTNNFTYQHTYTGD